MATQRFRAKRSRDLQLRADEFSGSLLQECRHALAEILRGAGDVLRAAFEIELLLVGILRAFPVQATDEAKRDGRTIGEVVRQPKRLRHQRLVIEDAIDEAPGERDLGWQALAEERKLDRAPRPISRGSSHVEPQSGTKPIRRNAWRK